MVAREGFLGMLELVPFSMTVKRPFFLGSTLMVSSASGTLALVSLLSSRLPRCKNMRGEAYRYGMTSNVKILLSTRASNIFPSPTTHPLLPSSDCLEVELIAAKLLSDFP
jgi:hypothetical protein